MTDRAETQALRRFLVYALEGSSSGVADYVVHALAGIRAHAAKIIVAVPGSADADARARLGALADEVVAYTGESFSPLVYERVVRSFADDVSEYDEIVLTGDGWFGPVTDMAPVLQRMQHESADAWQMTPFGPHGPEAFPDEGFPLPATPWLWTAVRSSILSSSAWSDYWDSAAAADGDAERAFLAHFTARGFTVAHAFDPEHYPHHDPALFAPGLLIDDGCPLFPRLPFRLYPPYLDRHAVIGRELVATLRATGYPMPMFWGGLVRAVPPKALNTNAGMLEILPKSRMSSSSGAPFSIVAVAHISDLDGAQDVLDHLDHLPSGYDLVLTTVDGMDAARLQRVVEARAGSRLRRLEIRVTPTGRGRDMSDLFVGCRDVLLDGGYDILVKVHARRAPLKTVNARRYFRRYQLDNLLESNGYVENLLELFRREPGLGAVFPPMMHIGYATMGRAWAGLRDHALSLCETLGIRTPLDTGSPLAPFGGMWIARPEALRALSEHRWTYRDYDRGRDGGRLAHLQERLIAAAAAERGYHCRTVLTAEHASISHSALEYKVDQLFSTTRGWPVEQIRLLHRAGPTGYGGIVALSRMYLRLNHPRAARSLAPAYRLGLRVFPTMSAGKRMLSRGAGRLASTLRRSR